MSDMTYLLCIKIEKKKSLLSSRSPSSLSSKGDIPRGLGGLMSFAI